MLKLQHLEAETDTASLIGGAPPGNWTRFLVGTRRGISPVVIIFLASALVTIVFWRVIPERFRLNEQSDYFASYEPAARNIMAGHGLSLGGQAPITAFPPGYPLILAGIFSTSRWLGVSEEVSLSAFAVICMALVSMFVFLLTRMFWGTLPALLSSLIWMTYPFGLWLTKQPNSELPFMVVFYGGLCLFWYALSRRMSVPVYFLCGFIFGMAMLIRPIAIGIGLVLAAIVWFARRELGRRVRLLMMAMLLLGNVVAVAPWEAWVFAKTGNFILLSTNGVKSMRDGLTFAVESKGYRQDSTISPDVVRVMNDIRARENEIATFSDLGTVLSQEVRSQPIAVIKLLLLKTARSWYGTDSQRLEGPILLIQLMYLVLVAWGSWSAWKQGGIYRKFVIGALLMTLYFWGMTFVALSILRYMVPAVGLLFVLIAGCYPLRLRSEGKPAMGTGRQLD
jgi:4-amino-4-deoxy-L-arabinose transferase-like glycosyltransferase